MSLKLEKYDSIIMPSDKDIAFRFLYCGFILYSHFLSEVIEALRFLSTSSNNTLQNNTLQEKSCMQNFKWKYRSIIRKMYWEYNEQMSAYSLYKLAPFKCCRLILYTVVTTLYYCIVSIDASTCKQHFNVLAGWGGANLNYFLYCWVVWFMSYFVNRS